MASNYMPGKGKVERTIELQSDLFQKGRLEQELPEQKYKTTAQLMREHPSITGKELKRLREIDIEESGRRKEIAKLEPYRNNWHERIIREDIKGAAQRGVNTKFYPTGETAMKIEGLGEETQFYLPRIEGRARVKATSSDLEVGKTLYLHDDPFVITDVLGEGKFKAVPKRGFTRDKGNVVERVTGWTKMEGGWYMERMQESFDISGKIDTQNAQYIRYEKTFGRYLQNKYRATKITDPQGVSWWEVNVPKSAGKAPIEAFGLAPFLFPKSQELQEQNNQPLFIRQ